MTLHLCNTKFVRYVIALCTVLVFSAGVVQAAAESRKSNFLINGDLTSAESSLPAGWASDAWQTGTDRTRFQWRVINGAGELEITNLQPNDARWIQKRHLEPGWYFFSGTMRAEGVPAGITGANLSLLEDGIISEQLHGTGEWKRVGLYLKVSNSGADVILACRLGGFAGLNTGKAFFRDLSLIRVDHPPGVAGSSAYIYDLDAIRSPQPNQAAVPPSSTNTLVVVIMFVAAIAVLAGLALSPEAGKPFRPRFKTRQATDSQSSVSSDVEAPVRRLEFALFLVCVATYAYFYQASDHNTASRIDLIRAILERHTLWIDGYAGYNTADIVQISPLAHIYSNKAPGAAFTGLAPWLLITIIVRLAAANSAAFWTIVTYLVTASTVSLISALTVVLVYRLALYFGASQTRGLAVALTLAFATIMFPYATEFAGEPIAAFCELSAFYLLACASIEASRPAQALVAGLLAGWGALSDYPTLLIALTIAGFALWKLRRPRLVIAFAAGAAAVAALLMIYNRTAFGHAFFLSYEAYMLPGADRFPEQAKGLAGITYPRMGLLYSILVGPQRGLFFCNPVLVLMIPGLYFFWRQGPQAEFVTITSAIIVFILFNASYGESIIYWGGGTATGPRHLLPVIPFAALTLVFLPRSINPAFAGLAFLSVFLMLMATAVEPHLPYEYTNPFRDFLWPAFWRGDFALNSSSFFGHGLNSDSAAFNVGQLIGLPGPLQLWPLGAMWASAAFYFFSASRRQIVKLDTVQAITRAVIIMIIFAVPAIGAAAARLRPVPRHGLLGCYYRGLRPAANALAHIQRVDREIRFDTIADLGALPSPSSVVWRGLLLAPASGKYNFSIQADDLGWLKLDGKSIIADPGDVTRNSDAGAAELNAGAHHIEAGERNIWGEASMHLAWQAPKKTQEIIPGSFLLPDNQKCSPG